MKKYIPIFITITVIIIGFTLVLSDILISDITVYSDASYQPLQSNTFGEILDISWGKFSFKSNRTLLILAKNNEDILQDEDEQLYSLFALDTITGDTLTLCSASPHKYLPPRIHESNTYFNEGIIIVSDDHLKTIEFNPGNDVRFLNIDKDYVYDNHRIAKANSISSGDNICYTTIDDNLVHTYVKPTFAMGFFLNNQDVNTNTSYYTSPSKVITCNNHLNHIIYTSEEFGHLNLYSINTDRSYTVPYNNPLIRDIVYCREINGYGLIGYYSSTTTNKYHLFMMREYEDGVKEIDRIESQTDMFDNIPYMDSYTFNSDTEVIYTSYDKYHRGKLHFYDGTTTSIIYESDYLYGSVKLLHDNDDNQYILYSLFIDGKNHMMVYNLKTKKEEDITMLLTK